MKIRHLPTLVDVWLILKCEWFCHKTQRSIGVDNFMWVRLFLTLLVVAGAWGLVSREDWASKGASIFNMSAMIFSYYSFKRIEGIARQFNMDRMCNPLKILPLFRFFRLWCLVGVISAVVIRSFQSVNLILDTLALYFAACDPLPPATSKLRELVTSLFTSNKTVTQNN